MKIIHDPKKCINCGNCVAICPEFFKFFNDKVRIIEGKENIKTGDFERDIEKEGCAKDAAETCPVKAIKIK